MMIGKYDIEWVKSTSPGDSKSYAIVTRQSPRTKQNNKMTLNITPEQFEVWQEGTPIQIAMPQLNADEREFLMTGLTADDWKAIFPPESETED